MSWGGGGADHGLAAMAIAAIVDRITDGGVYFPQWTPNCTGTWACHQGHSPGVWPTRSSPGVLQSLVCRIRAWQSRPTRRQRKLGIWGVAEMIYHPLAHPVDGFRRVKMGLRADDPKSFPHDGDVLQNSCSRPNICLYRPPVWLVKKPWPGTRTSGEVPGLPTPNISGFHS